MKAAPNSMSVLVAVPDVQTGAALAATVEQLGHVSSIVTDGQAALSRLERDVDVLLLDLLIEGPDGQELLRRKSGDGAIATIATIVVSNDDQAVEACASLWSATIVARIRNPADPEEVRRAVEFAQWLSADGGTTP